MREMTGAVVFTIVVSQLTQQPKNYSLLHALWTRCTQEGAISTQPSACFITETREQTSNLALESTLQTVD